MRKYSVVPKKSSPPSSPPWINVSSTLNHIVVRIKPLQQHWKGGTRGRGICKCCAIFLKNLFSWQCNDLGQKCIILRPSWFLIGSNALVTEKIQRTYASWLPSQYPAMLLTIEKEGTAIKPSFCCSWYDRIEEKGWLGLVPSQDLVSNFKFRIANMGSL